MSFKQIPTPVFGGQQTPEKKNWPKISIFELQGGIFVLLGQKKAFFFCWSESDLGCSECVLGAPKCSKIGCGGVECQNWVRYSKKKVKRFFQFGGELFWDGQNRVFWPGKCPNVPTAQSPSTTPPLTPVH